MVVETDTDRSAEEVGRMIHGIEEKMGAHQKNRPRIIDIDLLFYGPETIETPLLSVPHPKMRERAFVLVPLAEIAPDFVHPALGSTIAELLAKLGDTSKKVRKTNITV